MNSELCKKALELVVNPNILVNIISRRVRQLNSGGGTGSRPLIANLEPNVGAADTALMELTEGKFTWEVLPEEKPSERSARRRKRA